MESFSHELKKVTGCNEKDISLFKTFVLEIEDLVVPKPDQNKNQ